MHSLRMTALALVVVGVNIPAETIENPTKRAGAGPLFRIVRRGQVGFMDRTGKVLIPPAYRDAHDFFHGLAAVRLEEKWGYIDEAGKVAIPLQFDDVRDFLEGLAPVRIGRKWGYIDTSGRIVVEPRFQAAGEFHEGLAKVHLWSEVVCSSGEFTSENAPDWAFRLLEDDKSDLPGCFPKGGKFGFIDKTGSVVVLPQFFVADNFSEGLAAVRIEETAESKYGYIDRTGRMVIAPRFHQARAFSEGLAAVETSARVAGDRVVDIKWGFIDKAGSMKIPAIYEFADSFREGLAAVAIDIGKSWGYVDRDGRTEIPFGFTSARSFSDGLAAVCSGRCFYVSRDGTEVLPSVQGFLWPFSDGLAVLGLPSESQVYVDKSGRVIASYN